MMVSLNVAEVQALIDCPFQKTRSFPHVNDGGSDLVIADPRDRRGFLAGRQRDSHSSHSNTPIPNTLCMLSVRILQDASKH